MLFNPEDLNAFYLTLKLAFISTTILVIISTPLAWWLISSKSKLKKAISAILSLPLVVPPTVLGFYLLLSLGPNSLIGSFVKSFGVNNITFSFTGILIGSIIFSFPFVIRPIQNSMENVGKMPTELASTMGASPLDRFFTITLPLARNGIVNGAIIGFAHTIGEFGVILMQGGSIPGKTKVLSISIYEHVEALEYREAHKLAITILIFSFLCLLFLERLKATDKR